MAYGDGGRSFAPLAGALDVAAHEMTPGVIEKTVRLEYLFQSGALNESLADVFAAMVDSDDWLIGEDVTRQWCLASEPAPFAYLWSSAFRPTVMTTTTTAASTCTSRTT